MSFFSCLVLLKKFPLGQIVSLRTILLSCLSKDYNFGPSYITIAVLMVVCLGLTLLLPETKGKSLPDNVNDAGHHGNQSIDHRYGSVSQALDLQKSEHGVHTKLSPAEKNV